jgi:hypothetical protein
VAAMPRLGFGKAIASITFIILVAFLDTPVHCARHLKILQSK